MHIKRGVDFMAKEKIADPKMEQIKKTVLLKSKKRYLQMRLYLLNQNTYQKNVFYLYLLYFGTDTGLTIESLREIPAVPLP